MKRNAKFDFGVSQLPYDDKVIDTPKTALSVVHLFGFYKVNRMQNTVACFLPKLPIPR